MRKLKTLEIPGSMVAPAPCLNNRMVSTSLETDVGPPNLQKSIEQW